MWSGRFKKQLEDNVNALNASLRFDSRMYAQDIRGSIAHCQMLGKQGIISEEEARSIEQGLISIKEDIDSGALTFNSKAEDIHMFIEEELTARIGEAGKKLHTGRSRNDQVALDQRLYILDRLANIRIQLIDLYRVILEKARENIYTYMPGYTHLQRAQPVTFAHHLSAYLQMIQRDIGRIDDASKRMSVSPLGSGAMAGTTYPLDREYVSDVLGLSGITYNSMDGVSDRDFAIEATSALSILSMHISRFSEEIILWSSQEFKFIEIDDAYSTGSSIMPQKKNPDIAELARGKTGRVYGDLITLLVTMKGLPLTYNKDMQEIQEAVFDALDTIEGILPPFTGMIETMIVNKDAMQKAALGGFTNATDLADYLVRKGIPFRDAHEISGKLVAHCIDRHTTLEALDIVTFQSFSKLIENDIFDAISLETCVGKRTITGAPAPDTVDTELKRLELFL
ncbi:MAG: argininosuccinate lyase [Clostridiaceae bacterium]|nr:argininosuccinate lyase [Clostridiaceae bacterium]